MQYCSMLPFQITLKTRIVSELFWVKSQVKSEKLEFFSSSFIHFINDYSLPVEHPSGYLHSTKISFATLTALDAHSFF